MVRRTLLRVALRTDPVTVGVVALILGTVLAFTLVVALAANGALGCMELEGTIHDANLRTACVDK